jgi:hypothetical protein
LSEHDNGISKAKYSPPLQKHPPTHTLKQVVSGIKCGAIKLKLRKPSNQSINVTPVAMKLKKLMPAIH